MGIISKFTKFDKCVYWAPMGKGAPDRFGRKTYQEPQQLFCRWDDKQELIKLENGEQYMSSATVYVDIDLELGGILWHGLLADRPATPPGSCIIVHKSANPNLKNTEILRTVYI